jgi:hypothetical protein
VARRVLFGPAMKPHRNASTSVAAPRRVGLVLLLGSAAAAACQMAQMGSRARPGAALAPSSAPSPATPAAGAPPAGATGATATTPAPSAAATTMTTLPAAVARAKAASDAAPAAYKPAKDYALALLQAYQGRLPRRAPDPAWAGATSEATERLRAAGKGEPQTELLRSFDLALAGTLYGYAGRYAEAGALFADSIAVNPTPSAALATVDQALEVAKEAHDAQANETLCGQIRRGMSRAAVEKDLPVLMTMCAKQHPTNATGAVAADSFAPYVAVWASPRDMKAFRVHLATQACLGEEVQCSNRCITSYRCQERPLDIAWTKACKRGAGICDDGCGERKAACLSRAKRGGAS